MLTRLYFCIFIMLVVQQCTSSYVSPIQKITNLYYFGSHFLSFYPLQVEINKTSYSTGSYSAFRYERGLGKTYNKISSVSIVLSCYQSSPNLYDFQFDVNAYYLTDPTSLVYVDLGIMGNSQFLTLKFCIIFVGNSIGNYVKFIPFYIGSQSYQNATQIVPQTQFNIFVIKSFKVNSRLSSFYNQITCVQYPRGTLSINVLLQVKNIQGYCMLIYYLQYTRQFLLIQIQLAYSYSISIETTFGINITKFGTDFDRKCILGLNGFWPLNPYNKFIYDLDSTIGITNFQSLIPSLQFVNNFCIQDFKCPASHPYKTYTKNCSDCSQGFNYSFNQMYAYLGRIPSFTGTDYGNLSIQSIQYSYDTGQILSICVSQQFHCIGNKIGSLCLNLTIYLIVIIIVPTISCIIIVVASIIIYKKFIRKYIFRKQWKFSGSNDIIFQS